MEWLKPDKIRDAKKRRPEDPDYDPTTLFVPPDFYKNQTPVSSISFYYVHIYLSWNSPSRHPSFPRGKVGLSEYDVKPFSY